MPSFVFRYQYVIYFFVLCFERFVRQGGREGGNSVSGMMAGVGNLDHCQRGTLLDRNCNYLGIARLPDENSRLA